MITILLIYILHKIEEKINLYQQISLSFFRKSAFYKDKTTPQGGYESVGYMV